MCVLYNGTLPLLHSDCVIPDRHDFPRRWSSPRQYSISQGWSPSQRHIARVAHFFPFYLHIVNSLTLFSTARYFTRCLLAMQAKVSTRRLSSHSLRKGCDTLRPPTTPTPTALHAGALPPFHGHLSIGKCSPMRCFHLYRCSSLDPPVPHHHCTELILHATPP